MKTHPMVPNFVRYLQDVVDTYDMNHPTLRWGQVYFNVLSNYCPNLALKINGDPELDPFYDDKNIPSFMTYVQDRWGMYD
jgi:hypothetical protein